MPALICGSLAFDTITIFPGRFARADPARAAAHPERVVPGADAAPRVRRLRRQHRLHADAARRRAAGDGRASAATAPTTWRACRAGASRTDVRARRRRQLHRAGDHHHRRRQQPDHRVPPRRDAVGAPDGGARARRHPRSPSSRPTAATRCCSTPRSSPPPASRSSSIRARACRCSTATSCARFVEQASWVAVNDYEAQHAVRAHRRDARGAVALAPEGRRSSRSAPRAARCGSRASARTCRASRPPRSSTRPAAATPSAARCCTASNAAGRSSAAPSSATASAPSRSPSRGGQNHVLDRTALGAVAGSRAHVRRRRGREPAHHATRLIG